MVRKLKNNELNRLSVEEFRQTVKKPLILVMDQVRSALNVGSVFRTADSFAVEALYLCGITACPPNTELRKTALGADESVGWKYFKTTREALIDLKSQGYEILIVEQTSDRVLLQDFVPEGGKKYALVLGNEVNGVDETLFDLADNFVEIPQAGSKHSLNIAVTAGIVSWHFFIT